MDQWPIERRIEVCRLLIGQRRIVGLELGFDLCPSPTWDILLDLYLAHYEDRPTYLWALCVAANIPMSSAHRRICDLIEHGALWRSADEHDGRRVSVGLSAAMLARMDRVIHRIAEHREPPPSKDGVA